MTRSPSNDALSLRSAVSSTVSAATDLCGRPAPALNEGERSAPATGLLELGFTLLAKRLEVVRRDQRQQSLLEGRSELQGKPQVGVPWGQGHDLGPDGSFDPELAKQVEVLSPRVKISAAHPERFQDQRDQTVERRRGRVEVPGRRVRVFEHEDPAGPREPQVRLHLFVRAPHWRDLIPRVDEVEPVRLELARE